MPTIEELKAKIKAKSDLTEPPVSRRISETDEETEAEKAFRENIRLERIRIMEEDKRAKEVEDNNNLDLSTLTVSPPLPKSQLTDIILNEKQAEADRLILAGKSICLIGAAGTGKTSTMRKTTYNLINSDRLDKIKAGTKWLKPGSPGVVILAYTRKAANNIRKNVVPELREHTLTIHKLLEFAPVKYTIEDKTNGGLKITMKFEPQRNRDNPLPAELSVVIWEESSMISTELYNQFRDACQHDIQEIFLGDIQQLPPIFGSAVLGFKMLEFAPKNQVIQLTEVFRQALESPILDLAWKILSGDGNLFSSRFERYKTPEGKWRIKAPALDAFNRSHPEYGELKFQYWQTSVNEHTALAATTMLFKNWHRDGYYDPEEDIILCPFNKSFGSIEINKHLSQHFSKLRNATVYEIIAGFERLYMAPGDRVLYDKEDAFIETISPNPSYLGKATYATPSVHLDRWGVQQESLDDTEQLNAMAAEEKKGDDQVDYFLESDMTLDDIDDRVNSASHLVTIRISHSDDLITLSKAGDLNNLIGGYCISVHKAQGSEWEKVFLWLHHTHIKMCSRELLYTAVTRAKKYLHIMCETNTFEKGVKSQRIKGNTLEEKAIVFEGKLSEKGYTTPKTSEDLDISGNLQPVRPREISNESKVEDTSTSDNSQQGDDKEVHIQPDVRSEPKEITISDDKRKKLMEKLQKLKKMKSGVIGTGSI